MSSNARKRFLAAVAVACCPLSLMAGAVISTAGAVISVDTADIDFGTILEGQKTVVTHKYKIRNTGDSALHIKSVKAG
jgi:hypothetical protein